MSQANNLSTYLEKVSGRSQQVLDHARRLKRAETQLLALIGGAPGERFRVANLRGGVLVIQAQNPTWATRIRYLAPEILRRLQQDHAEYAQLHSIETRLASDNIQQENEPKRRASLSDHSLVALRDAVRGITDLQIKGAFERLLAHASARSSKAKKVD